MSLNFLEYSKFLVMPTRKSLEIAQVSFRQYTEIHQNLSHDFQDPLIFKCLGLAFCCSSPPPMLLFLKCSKNSKEVVPGGWGTAQTWAKNLHQIPVTPSQCQLQLCALTCLTQQGRRDTWTAPELQSSWVLHTWGRPWICQHSCEELGEFLQISP